MKRFKLILGLFLALTAASCRTVQYVPIETGTTVSVKDSTVFHIKDSVRVIEMSRYKDYGDLLKVLRIDGNRSHLTAWVDTTRNVLNGELVEDPVEEKVRTVYKDKLVVKDSIVTVEKPVPIEKRVEVKYVPKVYKFLSAVGLMTLLSVLIWLGLKMYRLKGTGFLKFIKNIIKKN